MRGLANLPDGIMIVQLESPEGMQGKQPPAGTKVKDAIKEENQHMLGEYSQL